LIFQLPKFPLAKNANYPPGSAVYWPTLDLAVKGWKGWQKMEALQLIARLLLCAKILQERSKELQKKPSARPPASVIFDQKPT